MLRGSIYSVFFDVDGQYDMDNNNVFIIGIVVFIIILLMLIAAFLLLKGSKGSRGMKKVRIRVKRASKASSGKTAVKGNTVKKKSSGNPGGAGVSGKAASQNKASAAKSGSVKGASQKMPQLRAPGDEGIEKYARMTEEYVRSKFDIELKRVGLKKYYSDRHGFECVDFTYRPASGVIPAQFRTHLNDVDTALSNVSGVDTITFAVDNATGTYRTTFYLGTVQK